MTHLETSKQVSGAGCDRDDGAPLVHHQLQLLVHPDVQQRDARHEEDEGARRECLQGHVGHDKEPTCRPFS